MQVGMGMGWYGPLIDLSAGYSHVDNFVELIVFVHRSTHLQYKLARGGNVVRTDIEVGDDTRSFFTISLWNHRLASSVSSGAILFFRNVKVIKFGSTVEARTVHYSSILRLIHPFSSLSSPGVDDLVNSCPVLGSAKEKLSRVIRWVDRIRSTLCNQLSSYRISASRNWKVHKEQQPRECFFLSEVLCLSSSCKVIFHASIGEFFLHSLGLDSKPERLFISRRLTSKTDIIVEDIIGTGCQLCGFSLCSESTGVGKDGPLYCDKSSNRLHTVGLIYRQFMLYVWDNSEYIPLVVTNKAAESLFGNITAEKVYQSYKGQKDHQNLKTPFKAHVNLQDNGSIAEKGIGCSSSVRSMGLEWRTKVDDAKTPNLYLIWLIVLKMLLLHGKNNTLKIVSLVNPSLEMEDGRYEMISVSMSCENGQNSSET